MVRGKFVLQSIIQHHWSGESRELIFRAEYDPSLPEDQNFAKATPTAEIRMTIENPEALREFKLGKAIYVDFHTT